MYKNVSHINPLVLDAVWIKFHLSSSISFLFLFQMLIKCLLCAMYLRQVYTTQLPMKVTEVRQASVGQITGWGHKGVGREHCAGGAQGVSLKWYFQEAGQEQGREGLLGGSWANPVSSLPLTGQITAEGAKSKALGAKHTGKPAAFSDQGIA